MEFIKVENGDIVCMGEPDVRLGVLTESGPRFMHKPNGSLISASESLAIANELSRLNNQMQWDKQNGKA